MRIIVVSYKDNGLLLQSEKICQDMVHVSLRHGLIIHDHLTVSGLETIFRTGLNQPSICCARYSAAVFSAHH
jgi:hypothetical protein